MRRVNSRWTGPRPARAASHRERLVRSTLKAAWSKFGLEEDPEITEYMVGVACTLIAEASTCQEAEAELLQSLGPILQAQDWELLEALVYRKPDDVPSHQAAHERPDASWPFLLRGGASAWSKAWQRESFLERFGQQSFKLRSCRHLHEYSYAGPWHAEVALMPGCLGNVDREWLEWRLHNASCGRERTSATLRKDYLNGSFPVHDDFPLVIFEDSYLPCQLQRDLFSGSQRPEVLSHIHAEPIFSLGRRHSYVAFHRRNASWMGQVLGRSAWFLAPPEVQRLEIAEPWNYVAEKPSEVIACVCEPGDVLYVPQAWWRSMWNLDDLSLGMGWEGADHGDSDWDEAMHAVADGDLQLLKSLDPQVSQELRAEKRTVTSKGFRWNAA
eukprot:g16643.t1